MNQATRVPVVSKNGKPLMPTTPARARKWTSHGKAVGKRNKIGVFYVQLLREPSGYNTQEIVAGTDRGKAFTGIAFQSKLATIALFHACLPGFYKSKKTSKDRQSVTGKMAKRTELRRTRRGQRINRKKPFKLRNHRQKRFSNRRQNKLPPSVKANRQMELRILLEMAAIVPLSEIRDETCGGNSKKNGFGISPVTVGQEWFRAEASKIAPVIEVDSLDTGKYRNHLGLVKDKKDKSKQCPETHANDAIALASTHFIKYQEFHTSTAHGHHWVGQCVISNAPFIVVTRPKLFRRKLHQENYTKGGILKRQGGTITPFGFRSGDYVQSSKKGEIIRGWVGGFSDTYKTKNISIYDHNWSRIGQFNPKKVKLIKRSTKLCVV
ncbi:RRXRR domain-containing protein [Plectonema cf. radiosum LEGE 06105]|uniref:RRXRR domain-containing protein n=1 Tax=Plectonema cf. radiosum LEGE 06105 TaxID=945769 RepID=A0A8J7K0M5_9CYAN|nr:RRXRR domain-containing protein [Plectonema radiosum]MBE9212662.1 RRXRR domain-containing protein [Plectonema cf. radiosum LEGE 06105]